MQRTQIYVFFFFNDTATTEIYTLPYTTLFRSLIPFAPLAFVSQRQHTPSCLFSPLAFQTISTHFTAPPFVPIAPKWLKTGSIPSSSTVEPWDFTRYLPVRLHTL